MAGRLMEFNVKEAWKICEKRWATPVKESFLDEEHEAGNEYDYLKRIIGLGDSIGM